MIFDKYPYTNFHEMNDDWLIQTLREFGKRLDDFVAANSLTYADPIDYDPATTYLAYTVVIYNDTAYMSKVTAPAGVLPTNDEYYLKIFPFGDLIAQMVDEGVDAGVTVLTERVDQYLASAGEEIDAAIANIPLEVAEWMDNHPEITTPIPNDSVSYPKLTGQLRSVLQFERIAGSPTDIPNAVFSQGSINPSTGMNMPANNVCRTDFYSFDDGVLTVRTLSGYSVKAYAYLSNETYVEIVSPAIGSDYDAFTVNKSSKYRFSIMKSDQSDFTPNDLPNNPIRCREFLPKYAKELALLNDAIKRGYSYADDWERGNILTNGALQTSTTKLRSSHFYDIGGKTITVSCNPAVAATTLRLNIFKYNFNGTFVSTVPFVQSIYYPRSITLDSGYVYKFVWTDSTNATTYASDITIKYPNEIDYIPTVIGSEIHKAAYDLGTASALVRAEKRNPFAFAPFDRGFVSFIWDDLRFDIDLVASIFAEYGLPIDIAAIPANLSNIASGLQTASHGYTVGMTMQEVCEQVVADGGEIMAHTGTIVTSENQYDYDFMYDHYVESKKELERAGFNIRGFIRVGGGTVTHTAEIEKWLIGNYEYSNDGVAVNYHQDRVTIDTDLTTLKARVLEAKTNHTWVRFMCHQLWATENQGITETNLRALLDYIVELGLDVVTYADVFDDYSSSQFLQS